MCEGLSKISSNFTLHLIQVEKLKRFKKISKTCKGGFGGRPRWPRPPLSSGNFFFLNISALHVNYGIQAFAKFRRPKCTPDCISENFNHKNFPKEHAPETQLYSFILPLTRNTTTVYRNTLKIIQNIPTKLFTRSNVVKARKPI